MITIAIWLLYISFLALFAGLGWLRFKRSIIITSAMLILIWLGSWVYVNREISAAVVESGSDMGAGMAGGIFLLVVTMLTALPAAIGLAALGLRRLFDVI